jgi:hypothetical protein
VAPSHSKASSEQQTVGEASLAQAYSDRLKREDVSLINHEFLYLCVSRLKVLAMESISSRIVLTRKKTRSKPHDKENAGRIHLAS